MAGNNGALPVRNPGENGTLVGGERQPVPQAEPVPDPPEEAPAGK